MREGVSKEEPWDIFDPSGVKILRPDSYMDPENEDIMADSDTIPDSIYKEAHFYEL
jgi:hypothetical protein